MICKSLGGVSHSLFQDTDLRRHLERKKKAYKSKIMVGSCGLSNEPSDSIKCSDIFE
jgi:hypothetical protein